MEEYGKVFEKVLYIGTDYKNPRGGIASVLNTYSKFIHPFKFVKTTRGNSSSLKKILYALNGYISLLWKLISDKRIKIVHIHSASENSFWRKSIAIRLAKAMNKKVIFHCHGGGFKKFRQKNPRKVDNILKNVDCVISLSNEWNEYFKSIGCKRVMSVKNVIDDPKNDDCTKDGLVHFLFLGLICDDKGIFDTLRALSNYKDELDGHIILHIGGNGQIERLKHEIKNLNIENLVRYEGWVDKERKQKLFNLADVYILPSYFEGVPISILEAESYHKPVITTNVGGIGSIVKNNESGLFVTPGDTVEIFQAMKMLADNETLRFQYGEAGYNISKDYLPEAVKRELIDCYSKVLES